MDSVQPRQAVFLYIPSRNTGSFAPQSNGVKMIAKLKFMEVDTDENLQYHAQYH